MDTNELKEKDYQKRKINSPQDDEVDLGVFFNKVGRKIDQLKNSTVAIFRLAIRNALLVLAFVLVSIGLGYAYYTTQRPFYNSSMTLMLLKVRNEFVEDQLQKLSEMIGDGNYAAIASRLEISQEAAKEIRSLHFSNLDEDRIKKDSVLAGSPFRIDLSLYDNKLFGTMEPALTNFMETNQFFSKQKQIRENQTRKLISKLRNDIKSIDSLKTSIGTPDGPVNGFVYGEAVDPTTLYKESVSMYREQITLESDLDRLNTIEVVNGFAPRLKPTGPKLSQYVAVAALIGLLLSLLLADKLEKRRRI